MLKRHCSGWLVLKYAKFRLPTLKTTSRTETQFKSQQYETFFRERVTKLKRQYSEAYEENDREAMLEKLAI